MHVNTIDCIRMEKVEAFLVAFRASRSSVANIGGYCLGVTGPAGLRDCLLQFVEPCWIILVEPLFA